MKTRVRVQVALIGATASLPALATATPALAAPSPPTTDPVGTARPPDSPTGSTGSTGPLGITVTPTDTPTAATPNCSTRAYTPAEIKAGAVSTVKCYATLAESLDAVGVETTTATTADLAGTSGAKVISGLAVAQGSLTVLAYHYDDNLYQGDGIHVTVSGAACDGMVWNAEPAWGSVISSTRSFCPYTKHYSAANQAGVTDGTMGLPGGVLIKTNNNVGSVKYWS